MATTLDAMSALARALVDAEAATKDSEQALKDAKERERVIREETIPSAMQEIGLTSLTLLTGEVLSIKQDVYASIPAASKQEAFEWLVENGFGGLIKTEVSVNFGKAEHETAIAFYDEMRGRGVEAEYSEGVHAQTLKAFLKEQLAKGEENLPLALFGARPVWTAKLSSK